MKLSVSLSEHDVALLDAFIAASGAASRSAALHAAILMLPQPELQAAYAAADDEWAASEDSVLWESTVGDGIDWTTSEDSLWRPSLGDGSG